MQVHSPPKTCLEADGAQLRVVWKLIEQRHKAGDFLAAPVCKNSGKAFFFHLGVGVVQANEVDGVVALCDFAHAGFDFSCDKGLAVC